MSAPRFPDATSVMHLDKPTGLVVLNMGGPDSLEEVEPFLYRLFSDRELIQLPLGALLQRPFARLISHFRAKSVRENYRQIGGRSPLLHWTSLQAQGVARRLGPLWRPYVAMRYTSPRAAETLARMRSDGIEQAVVLSLYPHYTGATTGSSLNDFRRAAARIYPQLSYQVIEQWYDWPGYIDALAAKVREGLAAFPEGVRERVQVVFSAHALPQKFIERGDPYYDHVMATVHGVEEQLEGQPWQVGFQSRSGPVEWMQPDTLEVLDRLAAAGHDAVLLVPISFVSDHIETLHEIDIEMRAHAEQRGIRYFERAPSLNDAPEFLAALASLVEQTLERHA